MTSPTSKFPHIVVIGAGIIGLQSAILLQQAGYRVSIIAEHIPGDEAPYYTFPWAGAQWRTHAKANEVEQQRWDLETYKEWIGMVRKGEGERAGSGIVPSTLYWFSSIKSETNPDLWWYSAVEDFTQLPATELPEGFQSSVRFTTTCINVPRHLRYLLSSFRVAGGKVFKTRLPTPQGFHGSLDFARALVKDNGLGEVSIVVNATGLGARALVRDDNMFPTKGQTVLVKGESRFAKTTDKNHYVIPRPGSGTTILGGTREDGNSSINVSDETTASILEGCKPLAPELLNSNGEFEVLSVQCGLRPSRKGGPRVEVEVVGGEYLVVHSYGHAGAGYQNAVGSSRKVVRLVKDLAGQMSCQAKL